MKILFICLIAVVFSTLSACKKDFLELYPGDRLTTENFYETQNDFERALVGSYARIRPLFGNSALLFAAELSTDNTEIQWSSPSVAEMQFDQNNLSSSNGTINGIWSTCLFAVANCNVIINRIDNASFDESAKNKILGEAKFIRAFCYFYMVRLFGNVPITREEFGSPEDVQNADLSLKPSDETYQFILEDLLSAESLLPAAAVNDKTKASLGTVKTLLGKVYLTMHDYDQAAIKLKEVIDLQQYRLEDDYASLFAPGNNNAEESILEIQFVSGRTLGNNFSAMFTPAITSMAIFPNNLQGSGRIVPTRDMLNAYETGDLRKAASVKDTVALIGGGQSYSPYGLKFVDWNAIDLSDGSVAFTVLRYADVLLMYAEALNEQGNTPAALGYLNEVRQRVALPARAEIDQQACRLALEQERRVEFLYEGHRWFDLVRTGRAREVLNAHFASLGLNFSVEAFELIFPIPLNEILLNPSLVQNEGY